MAESSVGMKTISRDGKEESVIVEVQRESDGRIVVVSNLRRVKE